MLLYSRKSCNWWRDFDRNLYRSLAGIECQLRLSVVYVFKKKTLNFFSEIGAFFFFPKKNGPSFFCFLGPRSWEVIFLNMVPLQWRDCIRLMHTDALFKLLVNCKLLYFSYLVIADLGGGSDLNVGTVCFGCFVFYRSEDGGEIQVQHGVSFFSVIVKKIRQSVQAHICFKN